MYYGISLLFMNDGKMISSLKLIKTLLFLAFKFKAHKIIQEGVGMVSN